MSGGFVVLAREGWRLPGGKLTTHHWPRRASAEGCRPLRLVQQLPYWLDTCGYAINES